MNREQIINNMCKTFRHDYGLEISEDDRMYTLMSGMTKREREALYRDMSQIFDNDIAPYMEFRDEHKFTDDHFSFNKPKWEQHKDYLNNKFGENLTCVELGAHEGRASLYMLDNFVGEQGHLYTIDYFMMPHIKENCIHNLSLHTKKDQATIIQGSTLTELPKLLETLEEKVHFIYIDAGKTAMDNIANLAIAERLLAVDGLLVVDDYEWDKDKDVDSKKSPRSAVNWFIDNSLLCVAHDIGYQAVFSKRNANDTIIIYNR